MTVWKNAFLGWEKEGGVARTALPISPKMVKLLEELGNKLRIPDKTKMRYGICHLQKY